MWYEILPAAGIIWAGVLLPHAFGYWTNYFAIGTPCRRAMYHHLQIKDVLRDRRLSGDEHTFNGLENIPDED